MLASPRNCCPDAIGQRSDAIGEALGRRGFGIEAGEALRHERATRGGGIAVSIGTDGHSSSPEPRPDLSLIDYAH